MGYFFLKDSYLISFCKLEMASIQLKPELEELDGEPVDVDGWGPDVGP